MDIGFVFEDLTPILQIMIITASVNPVISPGSPRKLVDQIKKSTLSVLVAIPGDRLVNNA